MVFRLVRVGMTEKGTTALVTFAYMRWPNLNTFAYAARRARYIASVDNV